VFAYENLGIGVRSNEGAYLEWLEEFFVPQFGVEDDAAADWEITVTLDSDRYERLAGLGPSREELLCFALDTRDIHLPRWDTDTPAKVLFDEKSETFFLLESESRRITLVSRGDGGRSRIAVMRVVRELAMNRAQRDGGVILHASAFSLGDRGVIVTGPKGAGKTTLLMYALLATPSDYVSNDRVLLRLDGGARIRGIPTIVTLREPTLHFFPPVLERLRESGYTIRLTRREASERPPAERKRLHHSSYQARGERAATGGVDRQAGRAKKHRPQPVLRPSQGQVQGRSEASRTRLPTAVRPRRPASAESHP
jgi:hypothetical protein